MKKILSLVLVAFVAISTQAASVLWKSDALSFGGTALKNNTDVVGYLVFLGNEGSLASSYEITKTFSATDIGTVAQTKSGTLKGAQVQNTIQFQFGDYVNNDAFALLVSYTTEGKTYWNLSSTINSLTGLVDEISTPGNFTTYAFNNATAEAGTLKAGGGWTTAVPEPASAMLALAGVAMLIRRRK